METNAYHSQIRTPTDWFQPRRRKWRKRPLELENIIGTTVCNVYQIDASLLHCPSRSSAHVALARQVAMYLAHVVGQVDYTGVGRLFGRDRTTVKYACAVVEDMRDDPTFDLTLYLLERIVERTCWLTCGPNEESIH